MPIQISPPDLSGLAGMSRGGNGGNLNLASPGALGLQALQQMQAAQAAQQNAQLKQQEINQAGALGLGQQNLTAQQQGLFARQLDQSAAQSAAAQKAAAIAAAIQGKQFDQTLALDNRKADITAKGNDQQMMVEMQKNVMTKLVAEKKEALQEKGAFASYFRMSLEQAKTPEEAQQITMEALKEAVGNKYLSKEQAKQFAQLPIPQRKNMLDSMLIATGTALEHKALIEANKPKNTGEQTITLPDGTVIHSVDPTAANKTKAIGELNDRSQALLKLGEMKAGFDPEYFTDAAQAKMWVSGQAERKKGVPLVGSIAEMTAKWMTGKDPEQRAKELKKFTGYMNAAEQFFNQTYKQPMTGAAVGKDELVSLRAGYLSGDMSPSQYVGALEQLIRKNVGEEEFLKGFLRNGADTSSNQPKRAEMLSAGYSGAEIDAYYAQKNGVK